MRLTLEQEYKQWLMNYELLLVDMKSAYYFKNKKAIDRLGKRILTTQVQIAICARKLEEKRRTNANNAVRPAIDRNVKIRKDSTVSLDRISWLWRK